MIPLPKIIVITGPTASGKTQLGLRIARVFGGEIINADSRQLYQGLDIATGKEIVGDVRHHLFDLAPPNTPFSLEDWRRAAETAIMEINARGARPIIVGGTVLYIRALVENFQLPQAPPNLEFREQARQRSVEDLYHELKQCDPKTAAVIERGNPRRLIRALEVVRATGKSFNALGTKGESQYDALVLGLQCAKKELEERISARVKEMFARGLIHETERLRQKYQSQLPALTGIGYAEAELVLKGALDIEEAQARIISRTKKYARRQQSFLKKIAGIIWIQNEEEALVKIKNFLRPVSKLDLNGI